MEFKKILLGTFLKYDWWKSVFSNKPVKNIWEMKFSSFSLMGNLFCGFLDQDDCFAWLEKIFVLSTQSPYAFTFHLAGPGRKRLVFPYASRITWSLLWLVTSAARRPQTCRIYSSQNFFFYISHMPQKSREVVLLRFCVAKLVVWDTLMLLEVR